MAEGQLEGRGRRVLVVDGHAAALGVLKSVLEERGYEVEGETHAGEALDRPDLAGFDVLISETALPDMDGFAFFDEVRRREGTEEVPFIFFTIDRDLESKVMGLCQGESEYVGINEYITRPCLLGDFLARLAAVVRRHEAAVAGSLAPGAPPEGWHMSGRLSFVGLGEILQELSTGRQTGLLRVNTDSGPVDIYLNAGEVYHATLGGDAEGLEVIQWVATVREGTFDFRAGDTSEATSVSVPTGNILLSIANAAAGDSPEEEEEEG